MFEVDNQLLAQSLQSRLSSNFVVSELTGTFMLQFPFRVPVASMAAFQILSNYVRMYLYEDFGGSAGPGKTVDLSAILRYIP